jgi:hypothetical protein
MKYFYNSSSTDSNLLDSISAVLKQYGQSVASNMLPGQQAEEGVYNQFRMTNKVLSSSVEIS